MRCFLYQPVKAADDVKGVRPWEAIRLRLGAVPRVSEARRDFSAKQQNSRQGEPFQQDARSLPKQGPGSGLWGIQLMKDNSEDQTEEASGQV